jgi:hypothetical protein
VYKLHTRNLLNPLWDLEILIYMLTHLKFKLETYWIHDGIKNFSSRCKHVKDQTKNLLNPVWDREVLDLDADTFFQNTTQHILSQMSLIHWIKFKTKIYTQILPRCRVSSLQAKPIKAEAKFEIGMSLCNGSTIDSRFKLKTSLTGSRTSSPTKIRVQMGWLFFSRFNKKKKFVFFKRNRMLKH